MGKNKKVTGKNVDLGRSLIKGRRQQIKSKQGQDSWRHTSELQDGYDWGRLNLQSVTEQSNLEDFLMTAEMAGKEFSAEKQDIKVVQKDAFAGIPKAEEITRLKKLQEENQQFVTIPRRPSWDSQTSAEQLELLERETFLGWRRSLAQLQETRGLLMTPYERNLNVWRQLWRVVERSDVVCQIVDARNPLLFKCDDLASYVQEVDAEKGFLLLINKADYLTEKQREHWTEYFNRLNTKVLFWSALEETDDDDTLLPEDKLSELQMQDDNGHDEYDAEDEGTGSEDDDSDTGSVSDHEIIHSEIDEDLLQTAQGNVQMGISPANNNSPKARTNQMNLLSAESVSVNSIAEILDSQTSISKVTNSSTLITRTDLVEFFRTCKRTKQNDDRCYTTIGLVGYPNVGKSSTINALLQTKKTAVSTTPGKTKHFQTLFLDDDLQLCDCPGLVFPTFVTTKAEMVLNGILPIDQIIEYVAPVNQICHMIPRNMLENTYGINIPPPKEGEDPDRPPNAEEFLSSYASMRGYMTQSGTPDCPRASRYILKDFVKGKLLYCSSPPAVSNDVYMCARMSEQAVFKFSVRNERSAKKRKSEKEEIQPVCTSARDEEFFAEERPSTAHFRKPVGPPSNELLENGLQKPWKKHGNRNKKEKLRRLYNVK